MTQLNNNKQPDKKWSKGLNRYVTKKDMRWQISTGKYGRHCQSLEKYKLKPQ